MKDLQIAEDIVPIGEFKAHVSQLIGKVQRSHRPVVITQNGRPAAVLISPADFDRLSEQARFVAKVQAGLGDAAQDRTVTDEELTAELKKEFG